jgi:hypothetical protein
MATTYNINGQQMTEEEFHKWQEENGFNFGFGGHRRQQRRWDHKMHIYQCYKDTVPNSWLEITKEDLKRDIGKEPKFTKTLFYVQKNGRDYIIQESPVVAVFYNHMEDNFMYMKDGGLIKESNCFKTYERAREAIDNMEAKNYNKHTLFDVNGNVIMQYIPNEEETPQ